MPSMTSSKSFRASIIPASFSMLRSNTDPESSNPSSSASSTAGTSTSTSHDPRKKAWHKSNTVDLSQLRDSSSNPGSATNSDKKDAVRHDDQSAANTRSPERPKTLTKRSSGGDSNKSATLPKSQSTTNLPPAKHQSNRKSRFRLSSLLPLITLPSESSPASPKKMPAKQAAPPPVPAPTTAPPAPPTTAPAAAPPQPEAQPPPVPVPTHSVPAAVATATDPAPVDAPSPAPTKSSSPTNTSTTTNTVTTAATAPTTVNDSPSSSTPSISIVEPTAHMPEEHRPGLAITTQDLHFPGSGGSPPSEASIPTRESNSLEMPQPCPNPQIMDPIPPSPEMQRAFMAPQEPMVPPPPPPAAPVEHSGKLRKENPDARRRSGSLQHIANGGEPPVQGLKTRTTSPVPDRGRRSSSVQSPTVRNSNSKSRVVSTPLSIRPSSSKGDVSQSPTRGRLRRSWLPGGGRSRSNSVEVSNANDSSAWVLSDDTRAEYNVSLLKNGEKVPELWNESGAVLVYLYPKDSGHGPSFKVQEFTISSSYIFNELIQTEREAPAAGRSRARSFGGRDSLTAEDAARYLSPPNSPPVPDEGYDDLRLYLPTAPPTSSGQLAAPGPGAQPDLDRLIGIRNLFAFLTGQPLVATKTRPTNFHAFLQIAALLEEFGFVSFDGATFGDAVDLSFGFYMDQHALADCRHSREKTLEALILGERMRSSDLYNEAFAHAAGKYAAIMELRLPLFEQVSPKTRVSLERAHLDLLNRQHNANQHLENFDFPAIFSGIANSTSMTELRHVRFKVWKNSFSKMRHFVMSYYKQTFGNWPPKASSKKNPFAESGLNRLVLKVLYSDMCALYDLIVDRTNRTSRVMDEVPALSEETDKMIMSALRNIMSEFDRSKPPVLPPVPYDCPQLPVATSILETYDTLPPKKQAKFDKNIKEHELILILNKAYNYDTNSIKVPFLDKFKEFELREARGKTPLDFADQRIGYWLFLYTVIQSLPVLVVDAPGMQFTEGVEYFLCEPPMGNPPWIGDQQVKKMWYEVAGGGGLVELSTDAVLFSVEATYHRSHCWLAAAQWDENGGSALPVQATEPPLSPLAPPRSMFLDGEDFVPTPPPSFGGLNTPPSPMGSPQSALRPRTHSPSGSRANQAWRSSIALGLEPVPLQPPSPFGERSSSLGGRPASVMLGSRSQSVGNLAALGNAHGSQQESPPPEPSGATFDDILGNEDKKPKKKKGFF